MGFHDFLSSLHLSKRESMVYIMLLEHGHLTISDLSRKTSLHRVALYILLPEMVARGLIVEFKRKRGSFYKAENPEKLEILFERNKKDFEKNIRKLKKIYKRTKKRPVIKFLEGDHGIKEVFDDVVTTLPRGATFYRYSSRAGTESTRKESSLYYKLRDQKKLERLVITSEKKGKGKKPKLERFVKTIPKEFDLFEDNVTQIIYGDKVAFVDYNSQSVFVIESEKIAGFQEKIFKLLYRKL